MRSTATASAANISALNSAVPGRNSVEQMSIGTAFFCVHLSAQVGWIPFAAFFCAATKTAKKLRVSSGAMFQVNSLKARWRHAFALEDPAAGWSEDERALAERLAEFIVRRRMGAAASMALEACRPLNFLGSQALTFLAPFATLVFSRDEYERFTRMLERRQSIDLLAEAIAQRESQKHG